GGDHDVDGRNAIGAVMARDRANADRLLALGARRGVGPVARGVEGMDDQGGRSQREPEEPPPLRIPVLPGGEPPPDERGTAPPRGGACCAPPGAHVLARRDRWGAAPRSVVV